ncbi:hypothetical protein [Bacillus altitudinis]|uniref:hypothetical protein n=1 Tax=Bacillus altitudinis TaxID=293387 RepID=UPI0011A40EFB|nr:hypothetical protein [Bacillus altitudinis]
MECECMLLSFVDTFFTGKEPQFIAAASSFVFDYKRQGEHCKAGCLEDVIFSVCCRPFSARP